MRPPFKPLPPMFQRPPDVPQPSSQHLRDSRCYWRLQMALPMVTSVWKLDPQGAVL